MVGKIYRIAKSSAGMKGWRSEKRQEWW